MKDLDERHVLGKVSAFVNVIEFQKRGLPHAHILLILDEADRPRSAEDYDKIVSAQLPDKELEPDLWHTVTKHMIHGPCGEACHSSSLHCHCALRSCNLPAISAKPVLRLANACAGALDPNAPCMVKQSLDSPTKVCSKHYLRDFTPTTIDNSDGYPVYARPDNGCTHNTSKGPVDNRWVVPHNRYLCQKYDAHINVEVVATVKAVKYLYKYALPVDVP